MKLLAMANQHQETADVRSDPNRNLAASGSARYAIATYFLVALATLAVQSVSMDELVEVQIASKSPWEIIWEPNSFPPLFHLVMSPIITIWSSPLALRCVSVLAGGVAVFCTYQVSKLLFGSQAGVAAAWLLALNPLHFFYAQQGRAYAFFYALTILTWWFMARAIGWGKRRDWYCSVLAGTLGCYTHYYFAVFLAVAFLSGCILAERQRTRIALAVAWTMIAIAAIPALFLLPSDFSFQVALRTPRPFGFDTLAYTYLSMFTGTTLGPSQQELHFISAVDAIRAVLPWGIGILLALLPLAWSAMTSKQSPRALVATFIMATLPIVLIGILGRLGGLTYNLRFGAWCLFPLIVFLSSGFATDKKQEDNHLAEEATTPHGLAKALRYAGLGCLILFGLVALWQRNTVDRYENEDLARPANYIQNSSAPSAPIFVLAWYMKPVLEFYMPGHATIEALSDAEQTKDFPGPALAVLRAARRKSEVWLVYSREFHGDPQGVLLRELEQDGPLPAPLCFAGVKLYRLQRLPSP